MVKKTQAAKNALHVSKNYAYLKPSTLRSMAKEISGTRLEACKSYAVSRLPKIAVTATLASLLACGAGLPTHQAWANGFNLPDGSYRYANRDSSTQVQKYVDISAVPCDKNKETDKDKADRATFGQYYKVDYQFNSHAEWWGGRPFWWASVPKGVEIVNGKVTLYKDEQLTGGSVSQQAGATYTKDAWNQSVSRFWFDNNKEQGAEFKSNWERMTGEAGGYDKSGNTLGTSREYKDATSALIINWESRGNRKSKISFVIQLKDKTKPLKFAAGVYQVMGNWHYTAGKVELAPTLPKYSQELELNYPTDKVEVDSAKYGKNLSEDAKKAVLTKLWEANKNNNADVLKKLNGMPEVPTEEAFKKAVKVNDDGSATVTYKDNSTDTISKENLTKRYVPLSERTKIMYPALTPVKDLTALDQSEKKQVENAIKNANKDKNIKSVTVDGNGKATITFDDKIGTPSTKTIEGKYLVKKQCSLADKFTPYYPVPMAVGNPSNLSASEQKTLLEKIYEINKSNKEFMDAIGNPTSADDAKNKNIITIDTKGNATVKYKDNTNDFTSVDRLEGSKMVYKSKPLADLTNITLPARTAVDNAKSLKEEDQKKVRQAILEANSGLKSKLKDKNDSAIAFDDSKHTMTVKFNDDSTSTFDYSELVYTKGNPEKPTMKKGNANGYTYNITKIAVADKNKLTQDDWHKFVRKFIQDNWKAKAGKSEINDQYINSTHGLLDQLHAPDPNTGGGMTLYKFFSDWDVMSGSTLRLGDNRSNKGIVSLYQHDDEVEIKAVRSWDPATVITLTKNDCFVSNAAAPNPEALKKEANDLIDKILKKNGLNDQEIKKFKEDHQGEINNITKPEEVDKIIKSADEHGKGEKKKKDAQKQIENATSGLDEKTKKELEKKIGNETDPEKIREKINEFQKDQDQKKQKEADQKQQQADQQAEQEKQQQQQKDDAKVDGEVTKQNQQEQQDTGKAEEAKKKAELEKQKQAAIDEIRNGEDYKNLTPDDKKQFIKSIQNATDEQAINTIKRQAKEKANQNQTAADSNNNNGLAAAKIAAKDKISKLNNLNAQDKQKYQGKIDGAGNLDKVAEILNNAEFEDAKAAAKKKIADLKQNGSLTEAEANDLSDRIDKANDLREVEGILEEAELKKAKKDAKSEVDKLTNLNKAQKDALKAAIDDIETDPTNENMKTIEKVKGAITAVVTKAKELDGKMKSLKDLVTLVNGQKSTLTAKPDYKDNKKTAFDSALKAAEDLVKTDSAENKTADEVDNIKKALENAVKDLGGKTVDKSALQTLINNDADFKKKIDYINAEKSKQDAYDNAISSGKSVLADANATADQVAQAVNAINSAKAALDGKVNTTELEQKVAEAKKLKKSTNPQSAGDAKYENASEAKKQAVDSALQQAESALADAKSTATQKPGEAAKTPEQKQKAVNDALTALTKAVNELDGNDKTQLVAKLSEAKGKKSDISYKNASAEKQSALDNAIASAEGIVKKAGATADEITRAITALKNAVTGLDGHDASGLQAAVTAAESKKKTVAYTNASDTKKTAFDQALQTAQTILAKKGATEKEISDATTALKNAVTGLDGHDASGLQAAVTDAESKKKTVAYTNASDTKKTAFDQALQTAQTILAKKGATEKEISDATTALKNASNALNGTVDTSKLQAEINKADSLKKSVQYTNAVQDKKSEYDTALTNAESALADAENAQSANTPDQKQTAVNVALLRLQTAAAALNGVDIADLQAEIALENSVKESVKYAYDTAEKQQTYNKALQDAKELISKLADPAGKGVDLAAKSQSDRQALVNTALKNLKNAKDALNGVNKTVLQAEVDDDSHFSKSFAYLLGEAPDLDVYKKALAEAKRVLADPNATQAQVDAALKDLQAAKNSIANKYNGAGTGNIGSGSGTGNAGTGNAGTGNAGTGNAGTGNAGTGNAGTGNAGTGTGAGAGNAGSGSEAGHGVNDNAPTTVDKGELNVQIQGAESDSQPGNAGNGNAGAGANTGNAANAAGKAGAGVNSGNAGNAANTNAANANANNANGVNSAVVNAAVENNPAVKQADAQVAKAQAALDAALAEAKKVAADPNATQAQVDAAVQKLSAARKALAAAKAHAADVRASVRAQVLKSGSVAQLSKTGSDVSVFGLFAATLSAAGAALFSAKRRGTSRHSNK
ncbi:GA module-containing protein [Gardnerella leopoldii]|uniref:GA module-containing protein n=1 Tax=Gardnerella leopoldii TaxID=2792978 RepID=UPI000DD6FA91|nr:GA module-containing protein [Gardnerella leopoldii]